MSRLYLDIFDRMHLFLDWRLISKPLFQNILFNKISNKRRKKYFPLSSSALVARSFETIPVDIGPNGPRLHLCPRMYSVSTNLHKTWYASTSTQNRSHSWETSQNTSNFHKISKHRIRPTALTTDMGIAQTTSLMPRNPPRSRIKIIISNYYALGQHWLQNFVVTKLLQNFIHKNFVYYQLHS